MICSIISNIILAEDGSEPETKPFFVSYPFVSTKDRAAGEDPFMVKETFFRKYIMKPQPQSTGQYTITIGPGPNLKVCKLVVIHIGDHFPCTKIPSQDVTVDFTETTSWSFIGGDDYEVGSAVQLKFMVKIMLYHVNLNVAMIDLEPDQLGEGQAQHRPDPGQGLHPVCRLLPRRERGRGEVQSHLGGRLRRPE